MKPETLYVFVTFFGPDRAQRSIAFLSLLNLLTNRTETSHLFTQSQFVDKKQRLLHSKGASNINYSTIAFNFDVCRLS